MPPLLQGWGLPIAVIAIANISATWYKFVAEHVPDPYLDEVFHVPQAQRYCKSDYSWDPKITTPPGLYIVSLLLRPIFSSCDTSSLRALNAGAICLVCVLVYAILRNIRVSEAATQIAHGKRSVRNPTDSDQQTTLVDAHTALNISLFPPLFFFSSLYYTDVMSTLVVLLNYNAFLRRGQGGWKIWDDFKVVLIGIVALAFRQTNIFWVAVFPAGLAVIEVLKQGMHEYKESDCKDVIGLARKSWENGTIYDCAVRDASLQDLFLFLMTTSVAVLRAPLTVLRAVIPFMILLAMFSAFVIWNGGVVLGDKSNHVATIHTPQMLYIWPYIVFFSFPLTIVCMPPAVLAQLPSSQFKSFVRNNLTGRSRVHAPGILSTFLFLSIGLITVHFNTIVHPFTLADNRHYVFYIFRIMRQHPAIKYLGAPVYFICYWMTIQTVGHVTENDRLDRQNSSRVKLTNNEASSKYCQLSFIAVWLITTSLSVVSAPLVEPRYFIVPWIIWRLCVPSIVASPSRGRAVGSVSYDMRLVLETAWFLAINSVIGYNFLYRGFAWPSEPGRTQRFLW